VAEEIEIDPSVGAATLLTTEDLTIGAAGVRKVGNVIGVGKSSASKDPFWTGKLTENQIADLSV